MLRFAVPVAAIAFALATAAGAADSPPALVGRGELVGGRGYSAWLVAWERWRAALPVKAAPDKQSCISAGQNGQVWFLGGIGQPDEHVITRNCSVPAGRYLMLGLPSLDCDDMHPVKSYPTTPRGLTRCGRAFWHAAGDPNPRLVLDGTRITPPGYMVWTRAFRVRFPARNNIFGLRGRTHGTMAARGFAVLLRPLAPGAHKIVQGISYRRDINRVVIYRLAVG